MVENFLIEELDKEFRKIEKEMFDKQDNVDLEQLESEFLLTLQEVEKRKPGNP